MANRSSFHFLSGDRPLSVSGRILWYLSNIAYAAAPRPALPGRVFRPRLDISLFPSGAASPASSPSRVLTDLMWNALPAQEIRAALGNSVRLLHIGCGNGHYLPFFDKIFSGVESYTGIDRFPNQAWRGLEKRDQRVTFLALDPADITAEAFGDSNVIVSLGALEHVRDDLRLFRSLAALVENSSSPVFQLHMLPSQNLWQLYGPHGYRGYHEANLKRLADCFKADTQMRIAALGGPACNKVHKDFLANAWDVLMARGRGPDRRMSDARDYVRALRVALSEDETAPYPTRLGNASTIGLILQTRMSVRLPAV